ncbi:hypothetical protein NKY39_15965 [Sinorhizobium meliloti]|uniref:hypothetical protein n=1 Tax=Rhizobium meliloti TaxID=382 RepID=UPI003D651FC9
MNGVREEISADFMRHRESFAGGDIFILAVLPDGRGFRCHPVESGLAAEELSRDEMIAAIIELYGGVAPFRKN